MANLNIIVISGEDLNREIERVIQNQERPVTTFTRAIAEYWYAINASPNNDPSRIGNLLEDVLGYPPANIDFNALPGWKFIAIYANKFSDVEKNFKVVKVTELCPRPKVNGAESDRLVEAERVAEVG